MFLKSMYRNSRNLLPISNLEVTLAAIENAALQTVPDSIDFYSPEEKLDLIDPRKSCLV